jgi:hypothetical protein
MTYKPLTEGTSKNDKKDLTNAVHKAPAPSKKKSKKEVQND